MSLIKEAAIITGDVTRKIFCAANNLVNPNKARTMKIIEGTGPKRHVRWIIVYRNPGDVIDVPTFDIVDES